MTAEGVFPKVDGDILFASETNRNFGNKLVGFLDQIAKPTSGTDFAVVGGSVLYSGVWPSLASDHFLIQTSSVDADQAGVAINEIRLRFSGTEFNEISKSYSKISLGAIYEQRIDHAISSGTFAGWGGNFGSPFVIFTEVRTKVTNEPDINNLIVTCG